MYVRGNTFVHVYVCLRAEVRAPLWFWYWSLFTLLLLFETWFLNEPRAHQFIEISWSASHKDPPRLCLPRAGIIDVWRSTTWLLRIKLSSLCLLNKLFTNYAISIVTTVPPSKDQSYSLENGHQNSSEHCLNVSCLPSGQLLQKLSRYNDHADVWC